MSLSHYLLNDNSFVYDIIVITLLQEWVTRDRVMRHLNCRGLSRIWLSEHVNRVITFLTLKGYINHGLVIVPSEIPPSLQPENMKVLIMFHNSKYYYQVKICFRTCPKCAHSHRPAHVQSIFYGHSLPSADLRRAFLAKEC